MSSDIPGIDPITGNGQSIADRLLAQAELPLEFLRTATRDQCKYAPDRRDCSRMRVEYLAQQLRALGRCEDADRIETELLASLRRLLLPIAEPAPELVPAV